MYYLTLKHRERLFFFGGGGGGGGGGGAVSTVSTNALSIHNADLTFIM